MRRLALLLAALALGACSSYQSAEVAPTYYDYSIPAQTGSYEYSFESDVLASVTTESLDSNSRYRSSRSQTTPTGATFTSGLAVAQAMPVSPPPSIDTGGSQEEQTSDATGDNAPGEGLLLIYNGTVVLAVYDVEAKQTEAIALIEEMGGFASERSSSYLKFRVPADRFREALDELGTLGDVLSVDWNAEDVTEEFRDLDIRLANAMQMRGRLEDLLTRAQTVEEALAIEQELERITLEIERIRGRMRSLEDMIAYSTIILSFQQTYVAGVPESQYRLPFQWLNTLGLPNLLSF